MAGFIACSELRIIDGMNKRSPLRSAAYRCSVRAIGFAKLDGSIDWERKKEAIKTDNNQRCLLIPRRREFNGTIAARNDPANVELLFYLFEISVQVYYLISTKLTCFHCALAFGDYLRITLRYCHSHHCSRFPGPVQVFLHEHRSMIERQVDFVDRIPVKKTAIRRIESPDRIKYIKSFLKACSLVTPVVPKTGTRASSLRVIVPLTLVKPLISLSSTVFYFLMKWKKSFVRMKMSKY